jgi:hypothetical protein
MGRADVVQAQRYVLDPERGHEFFLDAKPDAMAQNKGATFTENLVALRVRGPACPDLTLVGECQPASAQLLADLRHRSPRHHRQCG